VIKKPKNRLQVKAGRREISKEFQAIHELFILTHLVRLKNEQLSIDTVAGFFNNWSLVIKVTKEVPCLSKNRNII